MLRFKIHYDGDYKDSFVISGTSLEEIREQIYAECKRRGWQPEDCWSEEV